MNSWESIQKLNKLTAQSLKKTEQQHNENITRAASKGKNNRAARENTERKHYVNIGPFEDVWRFELKAKFPDLDMQHIARWFETTEVERDGEKVTVVKGQKEVHQVRHLVKRFNEKLAKQYLVWAIRNWEKLRDRFKKSPKLPNVGWLCSLASALMPEATMGAHALDVRAEANKWFKDHPDETKLPPELQARLKAAMVVGG